MFVDEIEVYARAGNGGDGVTRWRHLKFKPKAGPAGGNGGWGGNVYVRGVRDLNVLSKYTGDKKFVAANGEDGRSGSQFGKAGEDTVIDVPVGSKVVDTDRDRSFEVLDAEESVLILKGGPGGVGNEQFKSSTNTAPYESTQGKRGEEANLRIELSIIADVGLVGLPNAGKSSLLNTLTNARSKVGDYAFTTLEPHLGSLYGYLIADIPGLIAGAHEGKGLGDKFLRHISRTKMLLYVVSLDSEDPKDDIFTVKNELANYEKSLADKEAWFVFTKKDLANSDIMESVLNDIDKNKNRVFVTSILTGEGVKELQDSLVQYLETQ